MMRLVEKHLIRKSDLRFAGIDEAAFASKNLYNQANYQIRQAYIHEGKYLPYAEIYHRVKAHEAYCALPRKVSNSILIQLHKNWIGFFEGMEAYKENPSQFTGRPKYPAIKTRKKAASCSSMTNRRWESEPSRKRASSLHRDCRSRLPRKSHGTPLLK
jgi:putative transposase